MTQRAQNPLRLVNAHHQVLPETHNETPVHEFSDTIARDDPRWLLAVRAQVVFAATNRIFSMGQLNDLIDCGTQFGFSEMHIKAIVGIVEDAQLRGGLDQQAMGLLMNIPTPQTEHELSDRGRWITFGVLFTWSLVIAGMMQLV